MDTSAAHGVGGRVALGIAVAAALLATVWWGGAGLGTENFGSDCLFYYGETGPRAEHCQRMNDRAEAGLPRLVALAWVGAALSLVLPGLPRRVLPGKVPVRRAAAGVAVGCLIAAVALGAQAMAVSRP
ncbi:hypothetical protein SBI_04442 [Streptomyces bingchenggensis BCW-1]|uniref:Uncharacterized protein n=1 Tax=Streptomyces bingchenggensis (strain BCW-1) TaxID=749414 RepID=D7BVG1_STRBB|nr:MULTISPECIES: hypothetical protein [Streptomyces]ADI07562.1 hypothetical protein SBI_04442 [Streptomyces bingchenggensis BCW-1]